MENEDLPRPFGPYTLLDGLGRGGMGQVYLALRDGLAGVTQLSVIKTLRTQHASDAEYISRFEDEAKTVVQLSHRNIAQVFDVGIIDGTYYMAMELVRGVDLDTLNKRASAGGGLPPGEAVYIIAEALEALGYAHRFKDPLTGDPLNIVHRDVSPHNVMVSYEGEVKLIDFGLSASTLKKTETAPQVVMGKLLYMAPEQARDDPLDGRCDVYAIGIMLAEVLSGRRYYEGMSAQAVWSRVGIGFRSSVLDELPSVFADICKKATHPDVNARYASADAFRTELLSAARDQGWHSGSTELRGTLSTLLHVDEEAFTKRVRDAVRGNAERAPSPEATVITQQQTQVTTIASALGSALSSTSSGDVMPESDSYGGVYATSKPQDRPRASVSAAISSSSRAPALDVPEPATGDTAVMAIPSFEHDAIDGAVEALPPDVPTEQDGAAALPADAEVPQDTMRVARFEPTEAPPLAARSCLPVALAGASVLALSVVAAVLVLGGGETERPTGSPPNPALPDPGTEAPEGDGDPDEAVEPDADEAAAPDADEAAPPDADQAAEPDADEADVDEPADTAATEPGHTGGVADPAPSHTDPVEPTGVVTPDRPADAQPKRRRTRRARRTLPGRPMPNAPLPTLIKHLSQHCQQTSCTAKALSTAKESLGDSKAINESRRMLNQCIDRCHRS